MDAQKTLDLSDPRLAHLVSNPNISFYAHGLKNHWEDLANIISPNAKGLVRVYCFDGELDDQIRLENVLLHATEDDRIVIVAGRRIDGQDTVAEMAQVVQRTFHTIVKTSGDVVDWPNLTLVSCGPLLGKTADQKDMLKEAVETLVKTLVGQPFVLHNNTSATYLEAVLLEPRLQHQTTRMKIPFVSLHGSLSNYEKTTLPELEGWKDIMLLPVASVEEKVLYRNIVGFSFAIVLSWLATAYARAATADRQSVMKIISPSLGNGGSLAQANPELFNEKWQSFMEENLSEDDFGEGDRARVHRRFGSIAINLGFAYSNTIGDVSGCVTDMPTKPETVVAMPIKISGQQGAWSATIGDDVDQPSFHYAVVYADEAQTLDQAWSAIETARLDHPVKGGFQPVDALMKQGWRAYAELVEKLLEGIWEGRDNFPESSLIWLERARENVKNGAWAKYCRED